MPVWGSRGIVLFHDGEKGDFMVYVTADLHGCALETLEALLAKAGFSEEDFLFVLGDVIDRGPHGAELLLWLTEQPNVQLILGNHEAMLLACRFLFEEVTEESLAELTTERLHILERWLANGGSPTLSGLKALLARDPESFQGVLDYLQEAPLYEQVEAGGQNFLLVHGGLDNFRPERPLEDYDPMELLWVRPSLEDRYFSDTTVIIGHTPTVYYGSQYKDRALVTPSWICIDTGAAMGWNPMLLRLEDRKEFYL